MKKLIYLEDAIALAQSIEDEYDARSAKVDYASQTISEEIQCALANPAKETAKKWGHIADGAEKVKEALKNLPPVEPERKTGRWITMYNGAFKGGAYWFHCSECERIVPEVRNGGWNFCPNCGARMEEPT